MIITKIKGREILDSRGNPTVEARVFLSNGLNAKASVPSGASTGAYEACELRDGDKKRYRGLGVLKAVKNINGPLTKALIGQDILKPKKIDQIMIKLDGTKNKDRLGANAILALSLATARLAAKFKEMELYEYLADSFGFSKKYRLPSPSFNIINGGAHADNNLDFQEFMIVPNPAIKSVAEKIRMGSEIFHELGRILKSQGLSTGLGNEGGYAPDLADNQAALDLIKVAGKNLKYELGRDFFLGSDVGSSEFFDSKTKTYQLAGKALKSDDLINLYRDWYERYKLLFIEDGLAEDDWTSWQKLTKSLGSKIVLIGDDLFVTNKVRLNRGIKNKAANAILIKPNQVGTLSETIDTIKKAQANKYKLMISHRSGETCDDFIADLSVAVSAEYIKSGSLSRSERLVKYNRLMEIEENLYA